MELMLPGGVAERRPLWSRPVAEPRTWVCGGAVMPSARRQEGERAEPAEGPAEEEGLQQSAGRQLPLRLGTASAVARPAVAEEPAVRPTGRGMEVHARG